MGDETLTLRVVAHRIYGTRFEFVDSAGSDDPYERMVARTLGEYGFHRRELRPFLDRDHGTIRGEEEIRAFFVRDDEREYPEDMTVNDIYAQIGICWSLVAIRDHAVLSPTADFLSQTDMTHLARRIREEEAVNVYCVREIAGAYGRAASVVPSGDPGEYAALADRADTSDERWRFRMSLVTLSHELGHLLGLPHMPDHDNCLHTWSNPGAVRFDGPQRCIARDRARLLRARQPAHLPTAGALERAYGGPAWGPARHWHFDLDL